MDLQPAEYKNARDDYQKAYAALAIARRKNSRVASWEWAQCAARHAEIVGIENARNLLGTNTYPDLAALDAALSTKRRHELLVVTRHAGLIEWLKQRGYDGQVVNRATPSDVLNKHVVGKLPMHLAAIAASVTAVYIPNLPENRWGTEMTAKEMDTLGAYMRTYVVKEVTVIEPC